MFIKSLFLDKTIWKDIVLLMLTFNLRSYITFFVNLFCNLFKPLFQDISLNSLLRSCNHKSIIRFIFTMRYYTIICISILFIIIFYIFIFIVTINKLTLALLFAIADHFIVKYTVYCFLAMSA